MTGKRLFVVAGCEPHYRSWVSRNDLDPRVCQYVSGPNMIHGHRNAQVFFYETWREHPYSGAIFDAVSYCGLRVVGEQGAIHYARKEGMSKFYYTDALQRFRDDVKKCMESDQKSIYAPFSIVVTVDTAAMILEQMDWAFEARNDYANRLEKMRAERDGLLKRIAEAQQKLEGK